MRRCCSRRDVCDWGSPQRFPIADVLETVAAEGDPRKAKALLQLLTDDRRVNSRAEILPTYRLITSDVCAMSEKVGRTYRYANQTITLSGTPINLR